MQAPPADPSLPQCPDWLNAEAKAVWNELVPMLNQMRILLRIDGNALAKYCRLWARWKAAEQFIDEHGEMYPLKDDAGRVKCFQQFPQVAIAHRLALALTRMEAEFGMTPSARSRINVPVQARPLPGPDEFDERGIRIIDKLKFLPDSPYFKR